MTMAMALAITLAMTLGAVAPAFADDTQESLTSARRLIVNGAHELALARIERGQSPGSARWADWEGLRLRALSELGRWSAVVARAEALSGAALPPTVSAGFARTTWLTGAQAALRLQSAATARELAARVIWSPAASQDELRLARLVVIDSLFVARQPDLGYRAMLRYQQDHPAPDPAVAARFVSLLVEHGLARESLPWMTQLGETHPVRIAAQVRLGLVTPAAARSQARAAVARGGDGQFWLALRAVGVTTGDALLVMEASEQLINQSTPPAGSPGVQALWLDYAAASAVVANREHLLNGDDFGWSNSAARLAARDPASARALFAQLALQARDAEALANARVQLASALSEARLALTAARLFDDRARFPAAVLGSDLRRLLGELAAERGQFALAADYWQGLPAGAGQDADQWQLMQAQAQARAGRIDAATRIATALYARKRPAPSSAAIEATVVFADLLSDAGEFSTARSVIASLRDLLDASPEAAVTPVARRSLLLASASSGESGGNVVVAADQYLLAAMLEGFKPGEAQALDARLQAARNLARAGLTEEAQAQLDWIRRNTRDPVLLEQVRREQARTK